MPNGDFRFAAHRDARPGRLNNWAWQMLKRWTELN
jgi:hypothetical protein